MRGEPVTRDGKVVAKLVRREHRKATAGREQVHPPEAYLRALKNWQSPSPQSPRIRTACQPMCCCSACMRADTYPTPDQLHTLWVKEKPDKAQVLLAEEQCRSGYVSAVMAGQLKVIEPWPNACPTRSQLRTRLAKLLTDS